MYISPPAYSPPDSDTDIMMYCSYLPTHLETWDLIFLTPQWRQQLEGSASPFRPRARQWSITPTPTSLDAWKVALTHSHVKVLWQRWDSEFIVVPLVMLLPWLKKTRIYQFIDPFELNVVVVQFHVFSYVFVFGFRRSPLESGITWPCLSDDAASILWP